MNISKQRKSKKSIGMIIIFIFVPIIIIIIVAIIAILLSIQQNEISSDSSSDLSSNRLSDLSSNRLSINPRNPNLIGSTYIDCVGEWSDCSGNCERAIQTYKYIIEKNDEGFPCEFVKGETRECVKPDCPKDCVGVWSVCYPDLGDCGKGIKKFEILNKGNSDFNDKAKKCDAENGEIQECLDKECPADCVSYWTGCSKQCDSGINTYIISTRPAGNGKKCVPDIQDGTTVTCLIKNCNENLPTVPTVPIAPIAPIYPDSTCGVQYGNRSCSAGLCCSSSGWCGNSDIYCINGQPQYNGPPPPPRERCGTGDSYQKCDAGLPCCSASGWCGSGAAWCNNGQSAYNYVPVSSDGTCGSTNGRKCFANAPCCSRSGFCGSCSDNAYGGSGNQSSYNYVVPTSPPARCGSGYGNSCGQGLPWCSSSGWCGNTDAYYTNGQYAYHWYG